MRETSKDYVLNGSGTSAHFIQKWVEVFRWGVKSLDPGFHKFIQVIRLQVDRLWMVNMENDYQSLKVWQKSSELARLVYAITDKLPQIERDILSKQMRRCAVSITSNIAEGRHRATRKAYAQFLNIAYASGKELESQLLFVLCTHLVSEKIIRQALLDLDEIMAMLYVLRRKLLYLP